MEKKFGAALLMLTLAVFVIQEISNANGISISNAGASLIDIFTQKEPYSGVGINQSSDTFWPDEEVILYANVTYNLGPVSNKIVTYEVRGPPNPLYNVSLVRTANTNASGIATTSFRIPLPVEDPEIVVFGNWTVFGFVEIAEVVSDFLTFKVGWIVEILKSTTVNQDHQPKIEFRKGTYVIADLILKNLAMASKNVTLIITSVDAEGFILGSVAKDFEVEPNETQTYCEFLIPEWAAVGQALMYANLYVLPDKTFCPEVSTTFLITLLGDLNRDGVVDIRDLAIVAKAFGSYPAHPRWNPEADINNDEKIDIIDIAKIAKDFGKTDC